MNLKKKGSIQPPTISTTPQLSHEALVEQLLRPEAYPERPSRVDLVQTHVSSPFFAGAYVYKVKRPVNFGFLDYTTLARRKRYCQLEVSLNRPMAPDVYLGVSEVRWKDGGVWVGEGTGEGEVVDYAVKMRRLPPERALSALLTAGQISAEEVRHIGALVAQLHATARRSPAITRGGGAATVRRNVLENLRQTRRYAGSVVSQDVYDDISAFSLTFLEARAGLFARRAKKGA